ncbi:SMR family transporter [Paludibacterium paludis]|uniref:Multidrug SMR transporter n=1 Tax=Paludibacterium paludis TaxID=1225769 RepID=A0A918P1P9_9NEIS|nr:SMR family transporter [Paludibacterium paludis]GGY14048.1 multidrug SMR transporter [Paludibacterium paludis]
MQPLTTYGVLLLAIVLEVIGTSSMQASQQFTRLWPSLLTLCCYAGAFFCLSLTLKHIPVGLAYAMWSGIGIVLVSLIGYFVFGQKLDLPAIAGLGLIIAGVLVINLLSKTAAH